MRMIHGEMLRSIAFELIRSLAFRRQLSQQAKKPDNLSRFLDLHGGRLATVGEFSDLLTCSALSFNLHIFDDELAKINKEPVERGFGLLG